MGQAQNHAYLSFGAQKFRFGNQFVILHDSVIIHQVMESMFSCGCLSVHQLLPRQ